MSRLGKFVYYPMQKPSRIQPECPVYIYAYSLAVQSYSGAAFVQLRLVNRSERVVHSVFLQVSGIDAQGDCLYELHYLPIAGCNAEPHEDFGEDHLLFLPEGHVRSLEVHVEDVLFEDGLIWRKQNRHQLLTPEQAGWKSCTCGMKNPGEAESCAFCRRQLKGTEGKPSFLHKNSKHEAEPVAAEDKPWIPPMPMPAMSPIPTAAPAVKEPETPVPAPVAAPAAPVAAPVAVEPVAHVAVEPIAPIAAVPSYDPELLAQLLAPLRDRGESHVEQEPVIPAVAQPAPQPEPETPSARGSLDPLPVAENEEEDPFMQETARLLQEMQRRLTNREAADYNLSPQPADAVGRDTEEDPISNPNRDSGSRGILFWVLMVVLMIVLALVGFFGVLYLKGYFG
ncbi:MAG: hypothetical protein J6K89_00500 [Oscillospiraceae bacterium]|nr:hypothetical protein [Oscillospiraceae bacterium]